MTNPNLLSHVGGAGGSSGTRAYNSVNKGQNGRKGQQALQSSYFNRGALNANYMVAQSQDGSLRGG